MPQSKSERVPKYRKQRRIHRADDAFVEVNGQRVYLGEYNSPESHERYARWLAEREAGIAIDGGPNDCTVTELGAAFWTHAEEHYRMPDGSTSKELLNYKTALKHLVGLYGEVRCARFGPRSLKAVRTRFIQAGWCRAGVNRMVFRVRHVFKWGVENELVPASVYQALQAVSGLAKGRCEVRDNPPKRPVPDADIEAVRPHVARQVRALIDLQLYTGARSGELVGLRAVDIDTSSAVWAIRPATHKTAHHGIDRTIFCGPKAQAVLAEFMADRPLDAYLFDPRDAEAERYAKAETHRRTNQLPSMRKTDRAVGEAYTVDAYRRAIERGCKAAAVPLWRPHQLRHNAATRLRAAAGIDTAATILGHRLGSRVTEIYAEASVERAIEVLARVG